MKKRKIYLYTVDEEAFQAYKKSIIRSRVKDGGREAWMALAAFPVGCIAPMLPLAFSRAGLGFMGLGPGIIVISGIVCGFLAVAGCKMYAAIRDKNYKKVCEARVQEKLRLPFKKDCVKPEAALAADMKAGKKDGVVVVEFDGEYHALNNKNTDAEARKASGLSAKKR